MQYYLYKHLLKIPLSPPPPKNEKNSILVIRIIK